MLIPTGKDVQIKTIPKKTTGMVQPLDVYGFRIWKAFVKTFSDQILLRNIDINLHQRNNVLKLQSLVHNQLSSPRYRNLFTYSWYKSGYIDNRPNNFEHPVKFAFSNYGEIISARCSICGAPAIIKCSRCNEFLCFKHFFEDFHYHEDE